MSHTVPNDIIALRVTADEMRSMPKPVIVNVVATYDLSNPTINTEQLTMRLPGLGFNPQRFAAAKMRLPRAMTLAFCGGRAVCPGARSVMGARLAALRFAEVQLRAGEYVQYRKFRVQNIVMSVWADFEIELSGVHAQYSARTEWKASKFPGLAFRVGSNDRRIVFNIFVTGRVVITGSKNEEHSYKAWWWLYTYVLKANMKTSAPGTTSSATYRMDTHRRLDTLASDCEQISSRYTRRQEGPMAASSYGEFMSTPRMTATPMHVPVTPRAGESAELHGVSLFLERMNSFFGGHTATCPFVTAERDRSARLWFNDWRVIDALVSNFDERADEQVLALMQPHIGAGCVSSSVLPRPIHLQRLLRRYREQLVAAIGQSTMHLIGRGGALFGHTPSCAFVMRATPENWIDHREVLEVAMAGGVDTEEYNADALLASHSHAGCRIGDYNDDVDEPPETDEVIRALIVQLHHACNDFDEDRVDVAAEDTHMVDFDALTIDDLQDYEALYRLEQIRKRPDDWERVPFSM